VAKGERRCEEKEEKDLAKKRKEGTVFRVLARRKEEVKTVGVGACLSSARWCFE